MKLQKQIYKQNQHREVEQQIRVLDFHPHLTQAATGAAGIEDLGLEPARGAMDRRDLSLEVIQDRRGGGVASRGTLG